MAKGGHGVSDAVRNHISTWVTTEVASAFTKALPRHSGIPAAVLPAHLRNGKNWKRKARRSSPSGYGFEREYHCQGLGSDIKLVVHSPENDYSADRFVFTIGSQAIAGGKTKLKSTQVSAQVSKDEAELLYCKEVYNSFSDEELQKLSTNLSLGKESFVFLEMERG